MFQEDIERPDLRQTMAVVAPGREFVTKYFDRQFDRRVVDNLAEADDATLPAFMVVSAFDSNNAAIDRFRQDCEDAGRLPIVLRVPHVIGTGMNGLMMTLARGVARGTMLRIRDNRTSLSAIHATDIARTAKAIADINPETPVDVTISAPATDINDLIEALGVRIKDKRVGTISPRWARILYGRSLYTDLTTSAVVDTADFEALCPDFHFVSPAEYLKTHVYDNDSL